jgi:CDP-glycerol glycerophosphotransferase (TagB/SpsB family)
MMIQKIREKCTGLKYEIKIDADLHTLLSQASVLITEFSWMGFEGSLFDVPLIVTNFQGKNYSDYALLYHKEGIALYATTLTELFDCLNKILNDDQTQEKLREARKKLNYDFNYLNDGKAAERVFKILTKEA